MRITLKAESDGALIGTADVQKINGEWYARFETGDTVLTARVQLDDCDVWSMIAALLKEARGE